MRSLPSLAAVLAVACLASSTLLFAAHGASPNALILNEFNAVDSSRYLNGNSYSDALSPIKEDTYFKTIPGMPDGRIEGNGGNWVELVVTENDLNIQGWSLYWVSTNKAKATQANGTNIWYGDGTYEQGKITFSSADIWSHLRAGTIIALVEKPSIGVDTTLNANGNRNFTDGVAAANVDVTIDLSTNATSYNPDAGDWLIRVCTRQEQAGNQLVTTQTNVTGDPAGSFSVGPYDWQMDIRDKDGSIISGPIGEAIANWAGGNPNSTIDTKGMGKLQADPSASITLANYDNGTSSSFGAPNVWTSGGVAMSQDFSALRTAVAEPGTLLLLASGALALLASFRHRKARAA